MAYKSVLFLINIFLFFSGTCYLNAQNTSILDSVFEQYLIDQSIDSDGVINGQVLTSDISGITELNITSYNISDFEGLQDFLALTHFTLINNQETSSFSIDFDGNINLQEITIINTPNLGAVFGLTYMTNLTSLTIVTNGNLLDYVFLPSTLTSATIAQNAITTLNLENNISLKQLNVAANPISEINVSYLTELETLDTYQSEITYLDLSKNTKLTTLNSHSGVLTEVNLKNGNNNIINSVQLENNPFLSCIQVDNPSIANTSSGWVKDAGAFYSDNCAYKIREYPYVEDFENGDGNWKVVNNSNSSWELGTPSSSNLNSVASGSNAWVTNLDGNHNSNENSWVISPEFDFGAYDPIYGGLQIEFDIWYNSEINTDGAVFQSSVDEGSTWQNVGGGNFNFVNINSYNSENIVGAPGGQNVGWSGVSENIFSDGWKTVVFRIYAYNSDLLGEQSVFFRIAFGSNSSNENDGFAFDKFRISEGSSYAGEDATYNICIIPEDVSTPNGNLYDYLVGVSNGCEAYWTSLDGLPFSDENENSINFSDITEYGTYKFKYSTCFDESIIEFNIEKKLSVGYDSEYFDNNTSGGCSELTFESDEAFQQWAFEKHSTNNGANVDAGGIWFPSYFDGYGYYTYTQPATSNCPETSSLFLYNDKEPIITHEDITTNSSITNLSDLLGLDSNKSLDSNKNSKLLIKRKGSWSSRRSRVSRTGDVDFPNTGTGDYYEIYDFVYTVEGDCGNIESITYYTISVHGEDNGGEDGELYICEGDSFDTNDLFNALEGHPSPGFWTPSVYGSTDVIGTYIYNYYISQGSEYLPGGSVTVKNYPLSADAGEDSIGDYIISPGHVNLYNLTGIAKIPYGSWSSPDILISPDGQVEFPNSGLGSLDDYYFFYTVSINCNNSLDEDQATVSVQVAGEVIEENIQITFANTQNTNDGNFDYFEADIMIQTMGNQEDFKLGSGQLYFNYNTDAFGTNIFDNNSFEVSANYGNGYILGELSNSNSIYDITTISDNTNSRVSWSFSQEMSSGAITEIIGTTLKKLAHIKIKYIDVNQPPEVAFENDERIVAGCKDQFYTACGPFDSVSTTLDCTSNVTTQNVKTQFLDAALDSSEATLSNKDFELLTGISLYPNPTKNIIYTKGDISRLKSIDVYSVFGQHMMQIDTNFDEINMSKLQSSLYFIKLNTENASVTYKVVKE